MAEVRHVQAFKPIIVAPEPVEVPFKHVPHKAQYGGNDYANAVRVERGITLDQALEIAANDPEIEYFFITTGGQMVLGCDAKHLKNDPLHLISPYPGPGGGYMRLFRHGDTVFFKNGDKQLGDANFLADVYEKVK